MFFKIRKPGLPVISYPDYVFNVRLPHAIPGTICSRFSLVCPLNLVQY